MNLRDLLQQGIGEDDLIEQIKQIWASRGESARSRKLPRIPAPRIGLKYSKSVDNGVSRDLSRFGGTWP